MIYRGLLSLAAVLGASIPALAAGDAPPVSAKGEAELARLLDGREAGEPLRCIRRIGGTAQPMRTIDGTAYVFGQGDVLYVQRTTRPQDISRRFALSIRRLETTSGVEVCRTDFVQTFERGLGVPRNSVIFEDFVPYTRIRRD
jgi:hypothetical protein